MTFWAESKAQTMAFAENKERLARAARFLCKFLVLADYREKYQDTIFRKNQPLPHHLETWSEARLKETANEARDWLRDFVRISSGKL